MSLISFSPLKNQRFMIGCVRLAKFFRGTKPDMVGKGGTADIYQVVGRFGKKLAIKTLRPRVEEDVFENEVQALAALRHPNIIRCYGYGESAKGFFLVLEKIEAKHLGYHIQNRNSFPPELMLAFLGQEEIYPRYTLADVLFVAERVAEALKYMHRQGWVHTDVKPENIMWNGKKGAKGLVKILDFSLARKEGHRISIETENPPAHTKGYISPIRQAQKLPPSSAEDVFQLGITMYNLFSRDLTAFNADEAIARIDVLELPESIDGKTKATIRNLLKLMIGAVPGQSFRDFEEALPVLQEVKGIIENDEIARDCLI